MMHKGVLTELRLITLQKAEINRKDQIYIILCSLYLERKLKEIRSGLI